ILLARVQILETLGSLGSGFGCLLLLLLSGLILRRHGEILGCLPNCLLFALERFGLLDAFGRGHAGSFLHLLRQTATELILQPRQLGKLTRCFFLIFIGVAVQGLLIFLELAGALGQLLGILGADGFHGLLQRLAFLGQTLEVAGQLLLVAFGLVHLLVYLRIA